MAKDIADTQPRRVEVGDGQQAWEMGTEGGFGAAERGRVDQS